MTDSSLLLLLDTHPFIPLGTFELNIHEQLKSPLFSLPPEIRRLIWIYALDLEDIIPERPLKKDDSILLSCKRVLHEAWFIRFTQSRHVWERRFFRPQYYVNPYLIILQRLKNAKLEACILQIQRVWYHFPPLEQRELLRRVFYYIEPFKPRCVTILVDCWEAFKPQSQPCAADFLQIWNEQSKWINEVNFPSSVTTIKFQLRRLGPIDNDGAIYTTLIAKYWWFCREDGLIFGASGLNTDERIRPFIIDTVTFEIDLNCSETPRIPIKTDIDNKLLNVSDLENFLAGEGWQPHEFI